MRLFKYFKKRRALHKDIVTADEFFNWNNPVYVQRVRELHPERYARVLESLKRHEPENCLECFAFYWLQNMEDQNAKMEPACTMGGDFSGINEWKEICKNCPVKEKEIET